NSSRLYVNLRDARDPVTLSLRPYSLLVGKAEYFSPLCYLTLPLRSTSTGYISPLWYLLATFYIY
ncbi:hypothetical protein RRG08_005376, partial [Elysia crispata]